MKAVNPSIIYCSVSGYGQTGALTALPGHDVNYQALAGAIARANAPDDVAIPRVPIADLAAATVAALAICAAWANKLRTGKGERIDVAMADVVASWIGPRSGNAIQGRTEPTRGSTGYGVFRCADGGWLALGVIAEDHFWRAVCDGLGIAELGVARLLRPARPLRRVPGRGDRGVRGAAARCRGRTAHRRGRARHAGAHSRGDGGAPALPRAGRDRGRRRRSSCGSASPRCSPNARPGGPDRTPCPTPTATRGAIRETDGPTIPEVHDGRRTARPRSAQPRRQRHGRIASRSTGASASRSPTAMPQWDPHLRYGRCRRRSRLRPRQRRVRHGRGTRDRAGRRVVIGFKLPSSEAVDALYADLTGAGYRGQQAPCDAFWGPRYAVVEDPDGNPVGLMGPRTTANRRDIAPPS